MIIDEFTLYGGGMCPEQYDVYAEGVEQVAYLRLRHGYFRAECPSVGGETVYASRTIGNGSFDDSERAPQLRAALDNVRRWLASRQEPTQ